MITGSLAAWIAAVSWGSVADWINAIAVLSAAFIAAQTVRGYFKRRAAERQSDLAVDVLEAIYRYEPELARVRSVGYFLDAFDAGRPQLSDFQVANRKIESYERGLKGLKPFYQDLTHLLPRVRAVFG